MVLTPQLHKCAANRFGKPLFPVPKRAQCQSPFMTVALLCEAALPLVLDSFSPCFGFGFCMLHLSQPPALFLGRGWKPLIRAEFDAYYQPTKGYEINRFSTVSRQTAAKPVTAGRGRLPTGPSPKKGEGRREETHETQTRHRERVARTRTFGGGLRADEEKKAKERGKATAGEVSI